MLFVTAQSIIFKSLISHLRVQFPICKLLDFAEDLEALEQNANPVAVIIAAHLRAQQTRSDMDLRARRKWQLARGLYRRGFKKADIQALVRLLDWFLILPKQIELRYQRKLLAYERRKHM